MSIPKTRRSTTTRAPQTFPRDLTVRDVDLAAEEVIVGGKRLTEARAQKLADRAEASTRRRGRPSVSGGSQHSPSVSVRVPEASMGKLDRLVAATGRSKSDLTREALEEYLARH